MSSRQAGALLLVVAAATLLSACGGQPPTAGDLASDRVANARADSDKTADQPQDLTVEVLRIQRSDEATTDQYIRKVRIEGLCYLQPVASETWRSVGTLTPVACGRDQ